MIPRATSALRAFVVRQPWRRHIWRSLVGVAFVIFVQDHYVLPLEVKGESMAPALSPSVRETGRTDDVLVSRWRGGRWVNRNTEEDQKRLGRRKLLETQNTEMSFLERVRKSFEISYEDLQAKSSQWNVNNVARGDVVTFWSPAKTPDRESIKRVIALGGDTVTLRSRERWGSGYRERSGSGKKADLMSKVSDKSHQHDQTVRIPYGYVWLEGDNAEHSFDSRDYGPVSVVFGYAIHPVMLNRSRSLWH